MHWFVVAVACFFVLLIAGVRWGLLHVRTVADTYFSEACPRVAPSLPPSLGRFSVADPCYDALAAHAYTAAKQSCYATRGSAWLPAGWVTVASIRDASQEATGYVLRGPREAVVAFRGTFSLSEALSTLNARQGAASTLCGTLRDIPGAVHAGFAARFCEFAAGMSDALAECADAGVDAVYFTGHSLGGVFALLGALFAVTVLVPEGRCPAAVYGVSFGTPRVGNAEFAAFAAQTLGNRFVRVDNLYDVVVQGPVPTENWRRDAEGGFVHVAVPHLLLHEDRGNWTKNHSMRDVYLNPRNKFLMPSFDRR
jgi:hypothetical protein